MLELESVARSAGALLFIVAVRLVIEHQIWVRVRQGHREVLSIRLSVYRKVQRARSGMKNNLQSHVFKWPIAAFYESDFTLEVPPWELACY